MMLMKKPKSKLKVLCVCAKGRNRSKYLASYLKRKNYLTRFRGIEYEIDPNIENKILQSDVDWADIILIVRPRLKKLF